MELLIHIILICSVIWYLAIMTFLLLFFNAICDDDNAPLITRLLLNVAAIFWPLGIPLMIIIDNILKMIE